MNSMEIHPLRLPDLVKEQHDAASDPRFSAQLVEIAQRFASQKKRVIFISRAWPLPLSEDCFDEQWSAEFAATLAKHLKLLGFEVVLDVNDLGIGVHLNSAMGTSVEIADHVLLLITRTYLYKVTDCPDSGVAIEFSYIKDKIRRMGGGKEAGVRRFVLPLALTNNLTGFPLAEGHPGFAAIFVQSVGYCNALIDMATKVYNVGPEVLRSVVPSRANLLIEAVKNCYREKQYIPRHFHAEPIPVKDGYVRLAIVREAEQIEKMNDLLTSVEQLGSAESGVNLFEDKRLASFEQIYGAKKPINVSDIFKPNKTEKAQGKIPKRLLVLGRAGIGKSTLCQKIVHQWANSEAEETLWEEKNQEKFKLVILVPLRNLLDYPENATLADVILIECVSKDHTGQKSISKDEVLRGLKELEPDDILFVCDGYDEVAGRTTQLIEEILAKENVFVTTRPHGINQYLTSNHARPFDRKFENIGFLDEDIEHYIRAFFGDEKENQNHARTLIQFLRAHPNVWGIAHIPINLMLICVAWKDNYNRFNLKEIKRVTMTDLYYGLMVNLGRRYLDKHIVKGLNDFTSEDILAHEKCKPVLDVLSELAFQQMDSESLLIPGKALTRTQLRKQYSAVPTLREDVIHFGVLSPTSSETNSEKTGFYFVHLTFQEFLAAFYIVEQLRKNDGEIKAYILRNKYSRRHEMIWWFVAGLLKEEIEGLEMFFDLLESEPRDLTQLYHQMLLMRCMDECELKVKSKRKEQYLSNLCQLIGVSLSNDSLLYHTLTTYLNLSEVVSSQSEIGNKFCGLLVGIHENESRKYHLSLLKKVAHLPEKLLDCLVVWFTEARENIKGRKDVIEFFCELKNVPLAIQQEMAVFFSEPVRTTNAHALIFELANDHFNFMSFSVAFSNVWLDVQRSIANWFTDVEQIEGTAFAAVYFFRRLEEIPEEIQRSIAAFLCDSPKSTDVDVRDINKFMKYKMLKYFKAEKIFSKEILEEVQEHFVTLLVDPEWLDTAVEFFEQCDVISEHSLISIAALLSHAESKVRKAAQGILTDRRYGEVSAGLQRNLGVLLAHPEASVRKVAIEIFASYESHEKIILEEIQLNIQALLHELNWEVKLKAARFFCRDGQLLEEIQRLLVPLFTEASVEAREAALRFFIFGQLGDIPEDIQRIIAAFLSPSRWKVEILRFFSGRSEVSEEIQSCIAALLRNTDGEERISVIKFFQGREKVSEEMQGRIAFLLDCTDWRAKVAVVDFFKSRQEVSEGIETKIATLLMDSMLELRAAAVSFFGSREEVSEGVLSRIFDMLIRYPRWGRLEDDLDVDLWNDFDFRNRHQREGCDNGDKFFFRLKKVPEEIERRFATLLTNTEERLRETAVEFFSSREEVSGEIQNNTAVLLTDPDPGLRETAVKFFSSQKEVSEDIQNNIAVLLTDPEPGLRETAVKFFSSRGDVRKEIQVTIATLTAHPGKDAETAIGFFEKRQHITPAALITGIESLVRSKTGRDLDKMIKILNNISMDLIIECLALRKKIGISKAFLRIFIIKLLASNLSIYLCDKVCVQVGDDHIIRFEREEDLAKFVKNFKMVLAELTGFNFDKGEPLVNVFSKSRAVSRVGLLSALSPQFKDTVLLESNESKKGCVIF